MLEFSLFLEGLYMYLEGKLTGVIVHAAGMHQRQRVSYSLPSQDFFPSHRTNTSVGEGCGDDRSRLHVRLHSATLHETKYTQFMNSIHAAKKGTQSSTKKSVIEKRRCIPGDRTPRSFLGRLLLENTAVTETESMFLFVTTIYLFRRYSYLDWPV